MTTVDEASGTTQALFAMIIKSAVIVVIAGNTVVSGGMCAGAICTHVTGAWIVVIGTGQCIGGVTAASLGVAGIISAEIEVIAIEGSGADASCHQVTTFDTVTDIQVTADGIIRNIGYDIGFFVTRVHSAGNLIVDHRWGAGKTSQFRVTVFGPVTKTVVAALHVIRFMLTGTIRGAGIGCARNKIVTNRV